ncbi:MAG TPA: histidine phosphatase family protein [Desulfobacterales bacterium]|nr:histidine phosphatase family protein [Desulfobacterales bacterium]
MTKIHLIRHGQTEWNISRRVQGHSDSVLTDTGRKQAMDLGKKLSHIKFDIAYSSSSIRAYETAELILNRTLKEIHKLDSLKEINLGVWEGMRYSDVETEYPDQFKCFFNSPSKFELNGGETFHQLQSRAVQSLKTIVEANRDKKIILVSHGMFIRSLLVFIENRPLKDFWNTPAIHNCSQSIVEERNSGYKIIMYADLYNWNLV